jgi:DNA replication protein DnaC
MMSARPTPKTAALEALIEAHAIELTLPTVKARFRAMAAEATREQQTPTAYLAVLLEAEVHERSERRERRRLIDARFPLLKRLRSSASAITPRSRRPRSRRSRKAHGSQTASRSS